MTATRIVLKGTSGSGKTTIGRELARRLGAVFVELDALTHQAGWVEASDAELRASVEAALAGRDRWVVDGNYERKLGDLVMGRAELIVWLDLPLPRKLARYTVLRLRTPREVERWLETFGAPTDRTA
jgi:adenylate kinase family enzyme